MSMDGRTVEPINLLTMSDSEREAYARGIELAANLFAVATDEERLYLVGILRDLAAIARAGRCLS